MSLPGLGLAEPEEVSTIEINRHDLAKDWEWRFEVAVGKYIQVKVIITAPSRSFDSWTNHRLTVIDRNS
jgi:hypothetical protein